MSTKNEFKKLFNEALETVRQEAAPVPMTGKAPLGGVPSTGLDPDLQNRLEKSTKQRPLMFREPQLGAIRVYKEGGQYVIDTSGWQNYAKVTTPEEIIQFVTNSGAAEIKPTR